MPFIGMVFLGMVTIFHSNYFLPTGPTFQPTEFITLVSLHPEPENITVTRCLLNEQTDE